MSNANSEPSLRVMVVEDDPASQSAIKAMLDGCPVTVLFSSTVASAILLASRSQPDIVLVDLELPDGRGETVIQRLKLEPSLNGAVIAVITSNEDESIREKCIELGATDYLLKPVSSDALTRLLAKCDQ